MSKIASFKVDHTKLDRGIYVSRKDVTSMGETITTIDIRIKKPNYDMLTPECAHTIEHIGAKSYATTANGRIRSFISDLWDASQVSTSFSMATTIVCK